MESTDHDTRRAIHCMGCGYSLRGLAVDGDCPECGIAIATSISSAFTLRRRELVVLTCRLLAIWMIVMTATTLSQFVTRVLMFLSLSARGQPLPSTSAWGFIAVGGATVVIYSGMAALLWWGAGWFGRRIFADDGLVGLSLPDGSRDAARNDLEAVAFAAVGIYLFVDAIGPIVAILLSDTVYVATLGGGGVVAIIAPAIRAIVGLLLLLRAGAVVRVLAWLRTAGTHAS